MSNFVTIPYNQKDQTTNAITELKVVVDKTIITMVLELPTEIDGNKSVVKFANGEQMTSTLDYEAIEALVS